MPVQFWPSIPQESARRLRLQPLSCRRVVEECRHVGAAIARYELREAVVHGGLQDECGAERLVEQCCPLDAREEPGHLVRRKRNGAGVDKESRELALGGLAPGGSDGLVHGPRFPFAAHLDAKDRAFLPIREVDAHEALPVARWWVVLGSNQWPLLCESSALPLS